MRRIDSAVDGPVFVRSSNAGEEWRDHWQIVLAAFGGFFYLALLTQSFAVFVDPLRQSFGWSLTFISSGYTLSTLVTGLLSPLGGLALDRWGARRIALPGLVVTSFAIAAFALVNGATWQWYMLWLTYAVLSVSVKATVWTAVVARAFEKGRGLALGITLCGTAAAQAILPPLANWLITDFGWRTAYVCLGFGWGGVVWVLSWLFLHDARPSRSMRQEQAATTEPSSDLQGLSLGEAWRSRALWSLGLSTLLIMMLTIGLTIHQIPILLEAGVSKTDAAWLAGLAGLAALAGKLSTGVLMDRFRPNWVGGLSLSSTAVAFALLIYGVHSPLLIVCAMLINGYAQGTKLQICSFLTARYAGLRNYGAIYGVMNSIATIGSGLGPLVAGFTFDLTHSYIFFLAFGAAGSILSGLLIFSLPEYPELDRR